MLAPALLVAALALSRAAGDPYVYEVPPGGASLESQRSPLFFAARFDVERGRLRRAAWVSSDELLGEGSTRVIVAASWCPACRRLLERLPAAQPRRTVILFLEEENEVLLARAIRRGSTTAEGARRARAAQAGQPLAKATWLEGYPLPLYLLRSGSALARQVTQYPSAFSCSRTRCVPDRGHASGL